MPLTFPAHQAAVLPVKLKWPDRIDATALCVAAAAPDLSYPILGGAGHTPLGLAVFAVPFTLVAAWLLRRRAAGVVFANFPDLGPLRIHSYGVLIRRRPAFATTVMSTLIGAVSHIVIDSFTHPDRLGAELLGLDRVLARVSRLGDVTGADALQLLGHSVGSLIGLLLFIHIGRNRLLERWYGTDQVKAVRGHRPALKERLIFWAVVALVGAGVTALFLHAEVRLTFKVILGVTCGLLVAGSTAGYSDLQCSDLGSSDPSSAAPEDQHERDSSEHHAHTGE